MVEAKVNEDGTFTFDKQWKNVFLYGKEVNDFHILDKSQVVALHHSAIQELSRQVEDLKAQIHQLQSH